MFGPGSNPWQEEPENATGKVVAELQKLATIAESTGDKAFAATARSLMTQVQADRSIFRQNRKLFVIQVPALRVALEAAAEGKQKASAEALAPLMSEIAAAKAELVAFAQDMQKTKADAPVKDAALSLQVSRVAAVAHKQSSVEAGSTRATRIMGALRTAAAGVTVRTEVAGRVGQVLVDRTVEVSRLSVSLATQTALEGVGLVTQPLTARVRAIRGALIEASALAILGGLIAAIIFPPAAPAVVSLAYLSVGDRYTDILDAELSEAEQVRKLRRAGMSEEMSNIMAQFRRQPVMRTETEHLSVEIDLKTRHLDGTVLTGRYCGQRLSGLERTTVELLARTAPDEETKAFISKFLEG